MLVAYGDKTLYSDTLFLYSYFKSECKHLFFAYLLYLCKQTTFSHPDVIGWDCYDA